MPDDRERCRCGKRRYKTYRDAQRDCTALKRHNKRLRTLRVYWSKPCRTFHLGRAPKFAKEKR